MDDQTLGKLSSTIEKKLRIIKVNTRLMPVLAEIAMSEDLDPTDVEEILFQALSWSLKTNLVIMSRECPTEHLQDVHTHFLVKILDGFSSLLDALASQGVLLDEELMVLLLRRTLQGKTKGSSGSTIKSKIRLVVDNH